MTFYSIKELVYTIIGHLASRPKLLGARAHTTDHSIVRKLCSATLLASWQFSSMGKGRWNRLPSWETVFLKPACPDLKSLCD